MTRALAAATTAAAAVLALGGCGGHSSLSDRDLRTDATRICTLARVRTDRIKAPPAPSGGEAFLRRGLAVLGPELTELRTLVPSKDVATDYHVAIADFADEVATIRGTVATLKAGADPVVRFPELERTVAPLETRTNAAWEALGIDACVER